MDVDFVAGEWAERVVAGNWWDACVSTPPMETSFPSLDGILKRPCRFVESCFSMDGKQRGSLIDFGSEFLSQFTGNSRRILPLLPEFR